MTVTPYRSGGREDIDDEGYMEPLMVRNMSRCAKAIWDLRGSIELIQQIGLYYLQEMPEIEKTTEAENPEAHSKMGFYASAVKLQWDQVIARLDDAHDWCYMPELNDFVVDYETEDEPPKPEFLTGVDDNTSYYTVEEIVDSTARLKNLLGGNDNPNNAFNRGIKRGKS